MKTPLAILMLALIIPASASTPDQNINDALKKDFKNQILVLRSAFQDGDQEFDSTGKPLKDPKKGHWLTYGPLLITKIDADSQKLRLEGVRLIEVKHDRPDKSARMDSGKALMVDIHLDHPLASPDEARDLLDRVFFLDLKQARYPAPEFRLADESACPDGSIHDLGKDKVVPPRAVYVPDPDYSDKARQAKYQGNLALVVVVDATGRVCRIKMWRTLGMGLDEKAVEKVSTWKFDPGRIDGKPVAVRLSVEVSFHLY